MDSSLTYIVPLVFGYFLYAKGQNSGPGKLNPYYPIGPVQPPLQHIQQPTTTPLSPILPHTMPLSPLSPSAPGLKPVTPNSCIGLASTAFATYPNVVNPCPNITSGWKHGGANQSICNKLAGKGYIPVGNACQLPGDPNSLKFVMYWLQGK